MISDIILASGEPHLRWFAPAPKRSAKGRVKGSVLIFLVAYGRPIAVVSRYWLLAVVNLFSTLYPHG
jgi:hypothetical protein